jgi:hypothetical protein
MDGPPNKVATSSEVETAQGSAYTGRVDSAALPAEGWYVLADMAPRNSALSWGIIALGCQWRHSVNIKSPCRRNYTELARCEREDSRGQAIP